MLVPMHANASLEKLTLTVALTVMHNRCSRVGLCNNRWVLTVCVVGGVTISEMTVNDVMCGILSVVTVERDGVTDEFAKLALGIDGVIGCVIISMLHRQLCVGASSSCIGRIWMCISASLWK